MSSHRSAGLVPALRWPFMGQGGLVRTVILILVIAMLGCTPEPANSTAAWTTRCQTCDPGDDTGADPLQQTRDHLHALYPDVVDETSAGCEPVEGHTHCWVRFDLGLLHDFGCFSTCWDDGNGVVLCRIDSCTDCVGTDADHMLCTAV